MTGMFFANTILSKEINRMKMADKERKIQLYIHLSFFLSITIVQFWDWGGLGGGGTTPFYLILLLY